MSSETEFQASPDPGVKVSVCCITFNHAPYIRQSLEGLLAQSAPFGVEILVHDDASTDGTADIVREMQALYPGRITAILQPENRFSKGFDPFATLFRQARGQYLALCEGDDYWTRADKLAVQAGVLDDNPGVDICTHECAHLHLGADGAPEGEPTMPTGGGDSRFSARDVITNVGNLRPRFAHTGSIMLRREAALAFAAFSAATSFLLASDKFIKFFGARRGGGVAIGDVMAVHRINAVGSWTARVRTDPGFRLDIWFRKIDVLLDLRDSLDGEDARLMDEACRIEMGKFLVSGQIPWRSRLGYLASRARRYGPGGLATVVPRALVRTVADIARGRGASEKRP